MKGKRVTTTLLPYGPEKPRGGSIVKSYGTNEVQIEWEPPKGGFTKYVLYVDNNTQVATTSAGALMMNKYSSNVYKHTDIGSTSSFGAMVKDYTEKELSYLLRKAFKIHLEVRTPVMYRVSKNNALL